MKLTKDTPRLEEAVAFHNGVTQWTICNIMKEFTAAKRAAVIVKFIDVAMVHMSFCLSVCLSVLVYVCMCLCVSMYVCFCVYVCLRVCVCVCACVRACMRVCAHMNMCVHM